jgi:catechol 2,3-dioxygenase-like lactoylglutathione lyase family enzyme
MTADLFAGTAVSDLPRAVAWYSQLFGTAPAFRPNEDEAVWELAGERHLFLEVRPDHAGHARHLLFVDDLSGRVAAAVERGLTAASDDTLAGGVRKVAFLDPDGNEFGFGGQA